MRIHPNERKYQMLVDVIVMILYLLVAGMIGIQLMKFEDVRDADCIILAVAHNEFKAMGLDNIRKLYKPCADEEKVLIDVKGLYPVAELKASGIRFWRL